MLKRPPAVIGTLAMRDDGSLVLDLRYPAWSTKVYEGSHPRCGELLAHVGGLRPGETKAVPPWPDEIDDDAVEASLRAHLPGLGLSPDACSAEIVGVAGDSMAIEVRCGKRSLSVKMRKGSYEIIEG